MCKKDFIKRFLAVALSVVFMLAMTGCDLIPTLSLTESESHIIAEYSAGLLLKHDRNYKGNLRDLKEEEDDSMQVVHDFQPEEPAMEEEAPDIDGDGKKKPKKSESKYAEIPMSEALGIDGFDVSFNGMEAAQIYPAETEEMVFSMQSQQGMELLVMHFNLTNSTDSDMMCDVLTKDVMFRAIINGSERVASQHTILMNDLSQYHDNIAGYGMVDSVLIFEIEEGASADIESLDLIINRDNTNSIYKIL